MKTKGRKAKQFEKKSRKGDLFEKIKFESGQKNFL